MHAVSFHPGVVATGFGREGSSLVQWFYGSAFGNLVLLSPERGADTLVWLATARAGEEWTPGAYYTKRKLARTSAAATDVDLARELWERSEAAVGVAETVSR